MTPRVLPCQRTLLQIICVYQIDFEVCLRSILCTGQVEDLLLLSFVSYNKLVVFGRQDANFKPDSLWRLVAACIIYRS